jgi:MFS family permease
MQLSNTLSRLRSLDWKAWFLVLHLGGAFFLAYVARQSIFSIFPILRSQLQFTEVQLGLTGTVFLWTYALANPFAGYLGDSFSKKKLVVSSVILWSLSTLMIGRTQSVSSLLAWRAALALAQALYIPAAIALIVQTHSEYSRSKALSLHGMGQFAGVIFGGWYGGFVAESLGWRWMLWIVALAGILYGTLLMVLLKEKSEKQPSREKPAIGKDTGFSRVLLTPTYVVFCLVFFAICAMLWILYAWLPDLLQARFNLPLATAGLLATGYVQVAMIIGLFCGAPIGDWLMKQTKRGRLYIMIFGLTLSSPSFYLIAGGNSLEEVKLAAAAYGFFKGLFSANFLASVVDILPKAKHSFGVGFVNMIGAIAGGLSAYLVGLLKTYFTVEQLFGLAAGLGIASSLTLIIATWLFFLRDYQRVHPELYRSSVGTLQEPSLHSS